MTSYTPDNAHRELARRLGEAHYRRRLERQRLPINPNYEYGAKRQIAHMIHRAIKLMLKLTMMDRVGRRNFQNIRLVTNELPIAGLPAAFEGFVVLHVADLHLDLCPELLTPAVIRVIREADYDLCVNTGDYVARHTLLDTAQAQFAEIAREIRAPHFGVLGNHDVIEQVPGLEAAGIRLLLNEAAPIERDGQTLWLVGVDDPHYFRTDDLTRALRDVPPGATTLLLAHSPGFSEEAAASGRIRAMLCGHTHGGQICLPGGYAPISHCDQPDRIRGAWRLGSMAGYTSPGAGASAVAARFNCPPEITRHILRPK